VGVGVGVGDGVEVGVGLLLEELFVLLMSEGGL